MARPVTITDEQILDAAQSVLLEQGLDATTQAIAQQAGISEGTIFKRFKTKENLFVCAIMHNARHEGWLRVLEERGEQEPVLEHLERVGIACVTFLASMIPKMHMIMSRHSDLKERVMCSSNAPPLRAIQHLMVYLDEAQQSGLLLPHSSEHMARLFMATMHHYAFMSTAGLNAFLELELEDYVHKTIVQIFTSLLPSSPPNVLDTSPC